MIMEQKTNAALWGFKDKESGKWGFKNSNGDVVVSPKWWLVYHRFDDGMCAVVDDDKKIGFVDETGKDVIPCQYVWHSIFSEGLVKVQHAETMKMGYIDKKGETVIPFMFQKGGDFKDGLADVMDNNDKWGVINRKGKIVIPFLYGNSIGHSSNIALLFNEKGKQVFRNCRGEIIPIEQFKTAFTFHEGLVTIIDENDHYGFADENGHIIFSPQRDYADSFEGEFTYVRKGEDRFYMDHNGNMLPIHYESTINMSTGKGLDFLQRMYFKSVYPVKAAIEDEINRLSSQG